MMTGLCGGLPQPQPQPQPLEINKSINRFHHTGCAQKEQQNTSQGRERTKLAISSLKTKIYPAKRYYRYFRMLLLPFDLCLLCLEPKTWAKSPFVLAWVFLISNVQFAKAYM